MTYGFDMKVSACEITMPASALPVVYADWQTVTVAAGAQSLAGAPTTGVKTRFTGYLVELDWTLYPNTVRAICRGTLAYADVYKNSNPGGTDLTLGGVGQTDQAMVASVLATCGIAAATNVGGTGATLGTVAQGEFTWGEGESGLAFIERLDQVCLGYATFDLPGGNVCRVPITSQPQPNGTAVTFTEGADISRGELQETVTEVANRVKVSGYDDGAGQVSYSVQQSSPFLPGAASYVTYPFESAMIERQASADAGGGLACQDVATWLVGEKNRAIIKVPFSTPRDDLLFPGQTIQVNSPSRLATGNAANLFWIQSVTFTVDDKGIDQDLIGVSGIGSNSPIVAPPLPDFTLIVETETVLVAGAEAVRYFVYCRDASIAQQGTIASWAWSSAGSPSSGTDQTYLAVFSSISAQSITLTVTDSQGTTASIAKVISNVQPASTANSRSLYFAGSTILEAYDGTVGAYRNQAEPNGITVGVVGNGPIWAAGKDFDYSADNLISAPKVKNPFGTGHQVAAVWVEEDVATQAILAGSNVGTVALSGDGGATWGTPIALPTTDPCLRVAISRLNPSQWWVLTPSDLFRTDTAGGSWVTMQAAAGGETFRDFCFGVGRKMIAMAGGRLMIDADVGTTQTFPTLSPAVGDVYAVQPDVLADRFFCYDASGRTFATTTPAGTTFSQTAGATLPATCVAEPRGMWRDGDLRPLLYIAGGNGGAWKSIDGLATAAGYYQLRKPGTGTSPSGAVYLQVGADARLATPANAPQGVFVGTVGGHGGATGLYQRLGPGSYTQLAASTIAQVGALASPRGQPSVLWVVGQAVSGGATTLWLSTDGGATFTAVGWPSGFNLSAWSDLATTAGDANSLYVCAGGSNGAGGGIWKTTNQGSTWTKLYSPASGYHAMSKADTYLYVVDGGGNGFMGSNNYQYAVSDGALTGMLAHLTPTDGSVWCFNMMVACPHADAISWQLPSGGRGANPPHSGYVESLATGFQYVSQPGVAPFYGPSWVGAWAGATTLVYWSNGGGTGSFAGGALYRAPSAINPVWSQVLPAGTTGIGAPGNPLNSGRVPWLCMANPAAPTEWFFAGDAYEFHSTTDGITWVATASNWGPGDASCLLVTG